MTEKVVGSVVNTAKFRIDRASWKNLDKFQQRLVNLKKQMSNINGTFTLKANAQKVKESVAQAQKVSNAQADNHIKAYEKAMVKKAKTEEAFQKAKARSEDRAYAEDIRRKKRLDTLEGVLKQRRNLLELRYMKLQDQARLKLANKTDSFNGIVSGLQAKSRTHKVDMSSIGGYQSRFSAATAMLKADPTKLAEFNSEVAQIERGLRRLGSSAVQGGLAGAVAGLNSIRYSVIGISAAFAGVGVSSLYGYTKELQNLKSQLFAVSGSQQQAAMDYKWAYEEGQRLGTSTNILAENFAKLSFAAGDAMSSDQVKDLTTSFLELSTVAGASAESQSRGLYAISNMLGKKKIYSEELFQQLGESNGITMQAFTNAIIPKGSKQTLRQYMDEHKGMSIDILPKVAEEMRKLANNGGALSAALESLTRDEGRFKGFLEKYFGEFGNIFDESFKSSMVALKSVLEALRPAFEAVAHVLNVAITGLNLIVTVIAEGIKTLAQSEWAQSVIGDIAKWNSPDQNALTAKMFRPNTATLGEGIIQRDNQPAPVINVSIQDKGLMNLLDVSVENSIMSVFRSADGNILRTN